MCVKLDLVGLSVRLIKREKLKRVNQLIKVGSDIRLRSLSAKVLSV